MHQGWQGGANYPLLYACKTHAIVSQHQTLDNTCVVSCSSVKMKTLAAAECANAGNRAASPIDRPMRGWCPHTPTNIQTAKQQAAVSPHSMNEHEQQQPSVVDARLETQLPQASCTPWSHTPCNAMQHSATQRNPSPNQYRRALRGNGQAPCAPKACCRLPPRRCFQVSPHTTAEAFEL